MTNPRIELEAYVDKGDFDKKITDMNTRVDKLSAAYKQHGNDIAAAAKKSTMSWTDFRSAYSTVLDVARVGQQVWAQTVDVAQEYNQSVKDMMLSTGGTAEETSKLIQVIDDVGISYGTLETAMKMASKAGIEPNIESLAQLSDEYLKLAPGVERNQFLMEKFGRSGMDMARAMDMGGNALRGMADEMKGGLVLTQDQIDASEEYRKNVDELTDSWNAFKVSMGNAVIPVINETIEKQKEFAAAYDKVAEANEGATHRTLVYLANLELEKRALDESASSITSYTAWAKEAEQATSDFSASIEEVNESAGDYIKMVGTLSDDNQQLIKDQDEINKKYAEGKLTLDERNAALGELADAQEEASQRMILAMLQEQLAADGLTTTEMNYLLEVGQQWGIYSQTAVDEANKAIRKVEELKNNFNSLPTEKNMQINIFTNNSGSMPSARPVTRRESHASGGSFLIPSSYGNEGFMMGNGDTASGGERVTITPNGQSPAPAIDYNKMTRAFVTAMQQVAQ